MIVFITQSQQQVDNYNLGPIMSLALSLYQEQSSQTNQKILFLKSLLRKNRSIQASLKKIKHATKLKITSLEDKIKNHKVYLERPIMKSILAYLTLMKKPPHILKQYEMIKSLSSKDIEMLNKLSVTSNKKRSIKSIKNSNAKALSTNAKEIDFIELAEIEPQTYKNGLQRYRVWRKQNQKDEAIIPFSQNEESLLIQKQHIYRDNWDKICNFFDGRTFEYLYYRFQYYSNKNFKKGRWSLVQNIKLIVLVEHYGQKKWAAISKRIKDRSEIQVRQRFCNILDPKISKNSWTQEQIKILLNQAKQFKYKWRKIVQLPIFEGKTDNILWRKFRSLMIQKNEAQIRTLVGNKKLADTLIQIKKEKEKPRKKK